MFIAGGADTGDKLFTHVNDTGVIDTSDKLSLFFFISANFHKYMKRPKLDTLEPGKNLK